MNLARIVLFLSLSLHLASAQSVTGTVLTVGGSPVVGAAVETDGGAFATTTGATGAFTLAVTAGTYDILVRPATTLAPRRLEGVVVTGATALGTVTLQPGFALTGTVVNPVGAVVFDSDINVYEQVSGVRLYTPGDNTSAAGVFSVIVPAGTYRVRANPPAATTLAAVEKANVVVAGPTNAGILTLPQGYLLTGTVLSGLNFAPLANADIDVDNALTGVRVPTPNDLTSPTGTFSVVVPAGLFHVTVAPPVGQSLVTLRRTNVFVTGATALGSLQLAPGFVVSGTVRGPGSVPLADVDLDFETLPGRFRVIAANDSTNVAGQFSVVLPTGSYDLAIRPARSTNLLGSRVSPLSVNGNVALGFIDLVAGVALSGTVTGWNGQPEFGADLDLIDPITGVELVTPGDTTASNGTYSMIVPTGTRHLRVQPRRGSVSRQSTINNLLVNGPTTSNPILPPTPVGIYFDTQGIPTVSPGTFVTTTIALFNPTPSTQTVIASLVLIDPLGQDIVLMAPTSVPIASNVPLILFGAPMPVPPVAPAFLGQRFRYEIRLIEASTGVLSDSDGFECVIQ